MNTCINNEDDNIDYDILRDIKIPTYRERVEYLALKYRIQLYNIEIQRKLKLNLIKN